MIVAHLVPFDQARGAQRYARALVDHLVEDEHPIVTLFDSESEGLRADVSLNVPKGLLRRAGFDPRVVWRLRTALAHLGPDVVVAHGGESAKYAAFAAPRSVPVVYLKIGTEHPKLGRALSSALHRYYTRRADIVVAVSTEVAEELRASVRLDLGDVVVIPNGRDPDLYAPSAGGHGTNRLIWIGQLDTTKRPEKFIELVRALSEQGVSVEATMVGDGPRRAEIERLAGDAGVAMLGRRDDVPNLLAQSDVLVFTGRPPEGMPGVLIEAGLCQVPAVTTRVPGAVDVVDDGVTGLIVELDDFESLVESVRGLLEDASRRESMGNRARQRCVALFSFTATARRWQDLFHNLTDSGSSAP